MQRAIAVVRGCCQTSAAQTGTRRQLPRQTQPLPASFYEHRFPLFCRTSLPPGRERRACCSYLNQGRGLSPLPQGKTTTPNYSLKHARSGSDNLSASTYPLFYRPRRSGAITASGLRANVAVELPANLRSFELPAPPVGDELKAAIRSSLRILH